MFRNKGARDSKAWQGCQEVISREGEPRFRQEAAKEQSTSEASYRESNSTCKVRCLFFLIKTGMFKKRASLVSGRQGAAFPESNSSSGLSEYLVWNLLSFFLPEP